MNIWKVWKSINRKIKITHNHQLEITTLITLLIAHFTSMQLNKFTYGSPMPCPEFRSSPTLCTHPAFDWSEISANEHTPTFQQYNASTCSSWWLGGPSSSWNVFSKSWIHRILLLSVTSENVSTKATSPPSNAFGRHGLSFKILFKDGFGHSLRILLQATKSIGWKVHAMWHLVVIWDSIRSFCRW